MRSTVALLLVLLCFLGFIGCSSSQDMENAVSFYYCTNTIDYNALNGAIAPEARVPDEASDLLDILNLYVKGPVSDEFLNPFPEGTGVESLIAGESTVYITLSQPFAQLSELDLTIACACMCRTIFDLTDFTTVQFQCIDTLLGGNTSIKMSEDSLFLLDTWDPDAAKNP